MLVLAQFAALVCMIVLAYMYSIDKNTSAKKKLLAVWPYWGALLFQGLSWIIAIRGEQYINSFQNNPNETCPSSVNSYAIPIITLSIISFLLIVYKIIFAIKSKQVRTIILSVIYLLLLAGLSYFALLVGTFCLEF